MPARLEGVGNARWHANFFFFFGIAIAKSGLEMAGNPMVTTSEVFPN